MVIYQLSTKDPRTVIIVVTANRLLTTQAIEELGDEYIESGITKTTGKPLYYISIEQFEELLAELGLTISEVHVFIDEIDVVAREHGFKADLIKTTKQ